MLPSLDGFAFLLLDLDPLPSLDGLLSPSLDGFFSIIEWVFTLLFEFTLPSLDGVFFVFTLIF